MIIHMQSDPLPMQYGASGNSRDFLQQGTWLHRLDDGLALAFTRCRPPRALIETSHTPHAEAGIILTFGLLGSSEYRECCGPRVDFCRGHTTVTAFDHSRGERRMPAGDPVLQLRLIASAEWLTRYLGKSSQATLPTSSGIRTLAFRPTPASSGAHLQALRTLLQTNGSRIQLHIHALSLMGEQLETLLPPPAAPAKGRMTTADAERIHQARNIIVEELDTPLTLAYLAARVGLGEQKLKAGFQHLFDITPGRFLHEQRMRHAHRLLESGQQVAQAAYATGYRHPSNFSAAFSGFFGYPPKAVKHGR
jgi:AraC family transcriptional activator of pyochelin receptor